MYCKNCGKEITEESTYCIYCGARQKNIFCRNCGKEIPDNATFCPNCGTTQKEDTTIYSLWRKAMAFFTIKKGKISAEETSREETSTEETSAEGMSLLSNENHLVEKPFEANGLESTGLNMGDQTNNIEIPDGLNESHDSVENVEYTYISMPLFQRFCASIVDKFLIVSAFIILNISVHPFRSAGDLGIYWAMLGVEPANYEYIDRANINGSNGISNPYWATPYVGQTTDFDVRMTTMFVFTCILFLFVFEIILSGSPGKRFFGAYLLNLGNEKASQGAIFLRAIIRAFLFCVVIYVIHFSLGFTYYFVIIVLLVLIDISLLFTRRSLVDICSGTYYKKKGEKIVSFEDEDDESAEAGTNSNDSVDQIVENEQGEYPEEEDEAIALNGGDSGYPRKILYATIAVVVTGFIAFGSWYYFFRTHPLCPELVKAEKAYRSKLPMPLMDGVEIVEVAYQDSTFMMFYQIDHGLIASSKQEFQRKAKQGMLSAIQTSKGGDLENYRKFVKYHVAFIHKYIDKETGEVIAVKASPEEIEEALNTPLSDLDKLKMYIKSQSEMLPTEIDEGFIHKGIEEVEGKVIMSISVDEDIYDFYKIIELKDEFKDSLIEELETTPAGKHLCKMLSAVHYGLTYRYYGNQSFLEASFNFSPEEISNMIREINTNSKIGH